MARRDRYPIPDRFQQGGGLPVVVRKHRVDFGKWVSVTFERTLRLPEDDRTYPLPAGLGPFPIHRAEKTPRAPAEWRVRGDLFIPMYQREALWIAFDGKPWHPAVVQVGVGGINAVSGGGWDEDLSADPQNYVVCPDQPWLDGINAGAGVVRQFVAVPLGSGLTVERQLTGREEVGGIQLRVFAARPRRFPERAPRTTSAAPSRLAGALGIAAGGRVRQKIYADTYGLETWDRTRSASVQVHIVNSAEYAALTDHEPPPTPIDTRTYAELGLPWFDLYDEQRADVEASHRLTEVRSVGDLESRRDESMDIEPDQVEKLRPPGA
jgi:hypothetical protein